MTTFILDKYKSYKALSVVVQDDALLPNGQQVLLSA